MPTPTALRTTAGALFRAKQSFDGCKTAWTLFGRPAKDRLVVIAAAEHGREHAVESKPGPFRGRLID